MGLILDVENLTLVQNEDRLGKIFINRINALVARGYTVQGTGDGIATFQNSGQTAGPYNVFTSGLGYHTTGGVWAAALGGANKVSNARAWARLREPSPSTREIMMQRTAGTTTGFEMYATYGIAYAGYLNNNATANTPPTSAGVSQVINGGAFNGNGVLYMDGTSLIASSHIVVYNLLISDTARGGNSWPFYEVLYNSTLAVRTSGWIYESLLDYVPGDPDPVMSNAGTFVNVFGTPQVSPGMSFFGRRDDGTAVTALQPLNYTSSFGTFPVAAQQVNPLDSKLRSLPLYIINTLALDGRYKGRMEHWTLNMQARNYPSTLDLASLTPKLYLGSLMGQWKQAVTPGT